MEGVRWRWRQWRRRWWWWWQWWQPVTCRLASAASPFFLSVFRHSSSFSFHNGFGRPSGAPSRVFGGFFFAGGMRWGYPSLAGAITGAAAAARPCSSSASFTRSSATRFDEAEVAGGAPAPSSITGGGGPSGATTKTDCSCCRTIGLAAAGFVFGE